MLYRPRPLRGYLSSTKYLPDWSTGKVGTVSRDKLKPFYPRKKSFPETPFKVRSPIYKGRRPKRPNNIPLLGEASLVGCRLLAAAAMSPSGGARSGLSQKQHK